jgi:hypothetical protein
VTRPENDGGRALEDAASTMKKSEKAEAPESLTGRSIGGNEGSRVERDSNFGPVPVVAAEALAAGRFPSGLKGFGVLAYLHCRGWRDGVVETTIAKLAEAVEWEHSPRALRMLLESLRSAGYIITLSSDRSGAWRIEVPSRNRAASDRPKRKGSRGAGLRRSASDELPTSFRPPSEDERGASDRLASDSAQGAGFQPSPGFELPTSAFVEGEGDEVSLSRSSPEGDAARDARGSKWVVRCDGDTIYTTDDENDAREWAADNFLDDLEVIHEDAA